MNNTRLASVAVLHQIHTFIRHCSSPLFHDIGLFVEQLQQAVSDQEKKILEQQALLRKQRQAAVEAAAGQEGGDISMTKGPDGDEVTMVDGRVSRKHKASDEDLNDSPAQRARSSSTDSMARHTSSSALSTAPSALSTLPESAPEAAPAAEPDKQLSSEPSQPELAQLESTSQTAQRAKPRLDEFASLDESFQLTLAQMTDKAAAAAAAAAAAVAELSKQANGDHVDPQADQKPAEPNLAATPAHCTPVEAGTKPADCTRMECGPTPDESAPVTDAVTNTAGEGDAAGLPGGIKDVGAGVEHPLGGPKLDKPKRRKKFVRDSVKVRDSLYACQSMCLCNRCIGTPLKGSFAAECQA